jgi:large subunit ribosomal protein L29
MANTPANNPAKASKAAELRGKDTAALGVELKDLLKAHFSRSWQHATQQLNNNSALGKTKRDIARVKTVLRQKAAA